jgi:dUTPase
MVFAKFEQIELFRVEQLDSTDRGAGGFGSTGT